MTPTVTVLRGQRGSWSATLYQAEEGGAGLNLTGATVTAMLVAGSDLSFPVTITDAANGEISIRVEIPDNMKLGLYLLRIMADVAGADSIPWPVISMQVSE